jgi:hypothetical protein
MAQSINDPKAKRPRGQPRKITGPVGAGVAAADAAAKAVDPNAKPIKPTSDDQAAPAAGKAHTGPPAADPPKAKPAAPGFGANMVTADVFLSHVHQLNRIEEELEKAKLVVKEINGKKKDARQLAKADGIVLKEMDEAIENSKTDRVDHVAREERRRFYHEFLGIPLVQGDLFELDPKLPTLEQDRQKWRAIGNTDGRAGRACKAPDHCPPIHRADYEHGYTDGQKALMKTTPLTAGAFNADGSVKEGGAEPETWVDPKDEAAAQPPAEPPKAEALVMFQNADFLDSVKDTEDCSRETLAFADSKRRWDAAHRVVVLWRTGDGTGKKRVLKAPAKGVEGEPGYEPAYEDLGAPGAELTDDEPVTDLDAELDALVAAGQGEDETFGTAADLAESTDHLSEDEKSIGDAEGGDAVPAGDPDYNPAEEQLDPEPVSAEGGESGEFE